MTEQVVLCLTYIGLCQTDKYCNLCPTRNIVMPRSNTDQTQYNPVMSCHAMSLKQCGHEMQ